MFGLDLSVIIVIAFAMAGASDSKSTVCVSTDKCENANEDGNGNQARFDFYRMYYVYLDTNEQVKVFEKLEEKSDSCTFYGHARHPGQKLTIMVAAHKVPDFVDLLERNNVKHRVLTYNFQEKIDKNFKDVLPKDVDLKQWDWNHYFHLETIYQWMDKLAVDHPNEIEIIDVGLSTEGTPIKGIKFSRKKENKSIFIESGIHAREWIAPATATYIINELLTSTDPEVKEKADNFNWIILPCVNPDGYKYTFEKDRMWRKNRKIYGIARGVDLNRNYPSHWNETGSSSDPTRYDFSGGSAASETETKVLIEYIEKNVKKEQIKAYIALHSFSQLIMFPYGYTAEHVNNYDDLKAIGEKASAKIKEISGRIYKSGSLYETIYPSSGGSKDWAHSVANIPITYTFELRGPPDSEDLFILRADEIIPTAQEAFAAILTIVEESRARNYFN